MVWEGVVLPNPYIPYGRRDLNNKNPYRKQNKNSFLCELSASRWFTYNTKNYLLLKESISLFNLCSAAY